MAWKKTESWADYYPSETWKNGKGKVIRTWKTGLSLKEMKRRGHVGTFIVKTNGSKKYFKTKGEALSYAKSKRK